MSNRYSLISVDVDDLWTHQIHYGATHEVDSIIETSVTNAIQTLAEFGIRATFFIVAKDVSDRPDLMQRLCGAICAHGHEVANHSFWHKPYGSMRTEGIRKDIFLSTNIISEILGQAAVGFRSPSWGLNEDVVSTLEERGVKEIYACCTHPVFSGPALQRIASCPVKEVVVTDTIPVNGEKKIDKITVLPIAPLLGEAIHRIHTGLSIGAMFEKS